MSPPNTADGKDARFNSLHYSNQQLLALHIDADPETGWGVMPGYDQSIPIPMHLEPPVADADETLPSLMHPSYPFGRPVTKGQWGKKGGGRVGNLMGTVGSGMQNQGELGSDGRALGMGLSSGIGRSDGDTWDERGIREVLEPERKREVPPGMAGAKRPPSPPSPSLHPGQDHQPRSEHLRNLLARQRQVTPAHETDPFDAPLPNELFQEGEEGHVEPQGDGGQVQGGAQGRDGGMGDD